MKANQYADFGWAPSIDLTLALAIEKNGNWTGFGSAVIIGERLALTARHVLQNAWKQQRERTLWPRDDFLLRDTGVEFGEWQRKGAFKVFAINYQKQNSHSVVWNVESAWADSFTDIAILRLDPCSRGCESYEFKKLGMSARMPPVGAPVNAFGFHSPHIQLLGETEGEVSILVKNKPCDVSGIVLQECETTESAARSGRSFPGMRTSLSVEDSMSGGPVFDQHGRLCGIISSQLRTDSGNESYAAALWPAMCIPIDGFASASKPNEVVTCLRDLVELNVLCMEDWNHIQCRRPDGKISIRSISGRQSLASRTHF